MAYVVHAPKPKRRSEIVIRRPGVEDGRARACRVAMEKGAFAGSSSRMLFCAVGSESGTMDRLMARVHRLASRNQ
jgi:hypothetical protein